MKHTKNPTLFNNDASALGTLVLIVFFLFALPVSLLLSALRAVGEWADGPAATFLNKVCEPAVRIIQGK